MKNIVFFITHTTLSYEHADLVFYTFSQQKTDKKFDILYIYNSHQSELSNDLLLKLFNKYNLNKFFDEVKLFSYDDNTPKTLAGDIDSIRNYVKEKYHENDRILLIKSDTMLSVNYFDTILNIKSDNFIYFVSPFVLAKKRILHEKIINYCKRENFIKSDDITFFCQDDRYQNNDDFYNRPNIKVTDRQIEFISCYAIEDFSCHFLSVGLFKFVKTVQLSWSGTNWSNLKQYFVQSERCFALHVYHPIVSQNRSSDREGTIKVWLDT